MNKTVRRRASVCASALASAFWATSGAAHISLEQGGTHLSRYGDGQTELKQAPCGVAGGTRGTHIYTYAPGQTITVKLKEYIAHPSYFRWAFDNDGDNDFKDPASIKPIDPDLALSDPDLGDKCGQADYYNSPTVLPNEDNLDPHLAQNALPLNTFQITLPNVECDNCTLQVIQVMEDNVFHGDFNPNPNDPNDTGLLGHVPDIYHQCIDLVIKVGGDVSASGGGASGSGGATGIDGAGGFGGEGSGVGGSGPGSGSGGAPSGASGGDTNTSSEGGGTTGTTSGSAGEPTQSENAASSHDSGGCSVVRGASVSPLGWLGVLGLAVLGARRRRHSDVV